MRIDGNKCVSASSCFFPPRFSWRRGQCDLFVMLTCIFIFFLAGACGRVQIKALREGIDLVFPWQMLCVFSPAELQQKLCVP